MERNDRLRLIAEVRQRRADFPDSSGWSTLHFDALLEELDRSAPAAEEASSPRR